MKLLLGVCRPCLKSTRHPNECSLRNLNTVRNLPKRIGSGQYEEGDRVLVTYKHGRQVRSDLIPPLKVDGTSTVGGNNVIFRHNDIIGKPSARLYIDTFRKDEHKGSVRITHPSLEDWVSLCPRTVTPIYASYSALMTNLLDIHVDPPSQHNHPRTVGQPRLEILEAGTGHGSLTIHLARAIAAANPPPPYQDNTEDDDLESIWRSWKDERRAVVHTVEVNASRSKEAEKAIRSFRAGLYWPHIDFRSGNVRTWIQEEIERRQAANTQDDTTGFLDIVCLDMPSVHQEMEHVQRAMKNHAQLLVYVPQITQLVACQQEVQRLNLPLKLHQVLELGEGISNGRVWDLRFVKSRAEQKMEEHQEPQTTAVPESVNTEEAESPVIAVEEQDQVPLPVEDPATSTTMSEPVFPTMVCRPMVGRKTIGGAFVGLWRKVVQT